MIEKCAECQGTPERPNDACHNSIHDGRVLWTDRGPWRPWLKDRPIIPAPGQQQGS